ncbi:MAG: helix-turn-helix transcriptional regulator [Proteobacteria bacterium]|nr:helix-turn-helix transcriptional regulator [Pseudomonadota bacterium]MBS0270987.1 helix-turn-helix transcriptional regulator [Pseudomonadota bacterium]
MAPFTFSDLMKSLEPIGIDRWAMELNLKYGIRDSLGCPIGGRWIFAYWSPKLMSLQSSDKSLLYMGAAFATKRLQQLAPPCIERLGKGAYLTPRELAVLRALSLGRRVAEIGKDLALGEETVRSHIKKAQAKLGVQTPIHAVALAVRLQLIP